MIPTLYTDRGREVDASFVLASERDVWRHFVEPEAKSFQFML